MKIKVCNTIISRAIGLMFSKKLKDSCLLFVLPREQTISLHMFFVFYPIDVLFLNEKKEIVDMKKNFMPFTVYFSKKPAKYVIEMPQGSIKKINKDKNKKVDFSKL
jgi:uncharacterized protein